MKTNKISLLSIIFLVSFFSIHSSEYDEEYQYYFGKPKEMDTEFNIETKEEAEHLERKMREKVRLEREEFFENVAKDNVRKVEEFFRLNPPSDYITKTNKNGDTVFHLAASLDNFPTTDMLNILLEHGQYGNVINYQNKNGNTPLHVAVRTGNVKAARLLINHGANINLKNKFGNTPLDIVFGIRKKKEYKGNDEQKEQLINILLPHPPFPV